MDEFSDPGWEDSDTSPEEEEEEDHDPCERYGTDYDVPTSRERQEEAWREKNNWRWA